MKDLIINEYTDGHYTQDGERKRKKQQKEEVKVGTVKGTKEDQPSWLDTLKEEIENLKRKIHDGLNRVHFRESCDFVDRWHSG
jgi:hypothetical protein